MPAKKQPRTAAKKKTQPAPKATRKTATKKKAQPANKQPALTPGAPALDLARAFKPRTKYRDDYSAYEVKVVDIDPLTLTTGKIFAADPFSFNQVIPFERTVKRGTYPVAASIAKIKPHKKGESQQRVACVKVTFGAGEPVKWVNATKKGQQLNKLHPGEGFGYGVDAGTGCFCDPSAAEALQQLDEIEVANDNWEGYLFAKIGQAILSPKLSGSWILVPKTKANLVAFQSGWGDGFYASYWGLSTSGSALCLVTDFGVYPRTEIG